MSKPDGYHYVRHLASGCGEDVKVLVKDGKIVWFPVRCKCGGRIITSDDLVPLDAEREHA